MSDGAAGFTTSGPLPAENERHWSTDLAAVIAGFLVGYRAHKLRDLIHIMIELPSQ
jgi:hypothetical protein